MKPIDRMIGLAGVVVLIVCCRANAQPSGPLRGTPPRVIVHTGHSSVGGGYSSGGAPDSVVRILSNPAAREDLHLNPTQQQQIDGVLQRVRAMEQKMFAKFRQDQQTEERENQHLFAEHTQAENKASQQLARSTQGIMAQLTPFQRQRLLALCRSAAMTAARRSQFNPGAGGGINGWNGRVGGGVGGGIRLGGGGSGGGSYGGSSSGGAWHRSTSQTFSNGTFRATMNGTTGGGGSISGFGSSGGGGGGVGGGGFGGGGVGGGGGGGSSSHPPTQTWSTHSGYVSGGGPGSIVRVISDPLVQQQLRLNAHQRERITGFLDQVKQSEADWQATVGVNGSLAQQRAQNWAATRERYSQMGKRDEAARRSVDRAGEEIEHFLDPTQKARLEQFRLQALGVEALFKVKTIRTLKLSVAQQIKLASLRQRAQQQIHTLRFGPPPEFHFTPGQPPGPMPIPKRPDLHVTEKRVQAVQQATRQQMMAVLTADQQRRFHEMLGKPIRGIKPSMSVQAGGHSSAGASFTPPR